MRFKGIKGEWGFKALARVKGEGNSYGLTCDVFFSKKELTQYYPEECWDIKWPVEVYEDGSIRVIDEDELDEENV